MQITLFFAWYLTGRAVTLSDTIYVSAVDMASLRTCFAVFSHAIFLLDALSLLEMLIVPLPRWLERLRLRSWLR